MFDVEKLINQEVQDEIGKADIHIYDAQVIRYLEADQYEFYVETGFNQSIKVPIQVAGYIAPKVNSDSLDESEHAITAGDFGWKILADKYLRIKTFVEKVEVDGILQDRYIGEVYIKEVYAPEGEEPKVVWVNYADVMIAQGFERSHEYEQNPDEKPELKPRPETVTEE